MADRRPTKVTFPRAVYLCVLLLIAPRKFQQEEDADNKLRSERTGQQRQERSFIIVRHAFWTSLVLVLASGMFGGGCGLVLNKVALCAKPTVIFWLQVVGSMILLWGTLFVRGWEIETWSGVTLTEQVNQWLYRFLYCAGTAIIVLSLAWTQR